MPQMFPLYWFILFSSASLALLVTSSSLYFRTDPKHFTLPSKPAQASHTWKW